MIAPDAAARVCVDGGIPKGVDHEKGEGVIPEPGVHKSTVFFARVFYLAKCVLCKFALFLPHQKKCIRYQLISPSIVSKYLPLESIGSCYKVTFIQTLVCTSCRPALPTHNQSPRIQAVADPCSIDSPSLVHQFSSAPDKSTKQRDDALNQKSSFLSGNPPLITDYRLN